MTRGHPPYVAISEAERKAKSRDLMVFSLEPEGELPFHFVICDRDCISLVRVRRLKYPGYSVEEIGHSCKKDIAALRSIPVTAEIFRELWARGKDRHWYRYLVLPDSVEVLEDNDEADQKEPDGNEPDINQPNEKKPDTIEPDTDQLTDGGSVPPPPGTGAGEQTG